MERPDFADYAISIDGLTITSQEYVVPLHIVHDTAVIVSQGDYEGVSSRQNKGTKGTAVVGITAGLVKAAPSWSNYNSHLKPHTGLADLHLVAPLEVDLPGRMRVDVGHSHYPGSGCHVRPVPVDAGPTQSFSHYLSAVGYGPYLHPQVGSIAFAGPCIGANLTGAAVGLVGVGIRLTCKQVALHHPLQRLIRPQAAVVGIALVAIVYVLVDHRHGT